jgi:tetratricopeptide (TPR) repeat protein
VETIGLGSVQPVFLEYVGEAYVLADRLEDALEVAARALRFARGRGHRGYEAWALWLLGEVTARRHAPELADAHYRQSLALADELGMRPLAAHCHLSLGKLCRRAGQREQAPQYLTIAATAYREMAMKPWLAKAEAEL